MINARFNEDYHGFDTIVVPAHPTGFNKVFLGEKRWPNLKVDRKRLSILKYVAVYQTKPVSAITHYAKIDRLEPLNRAGRFDVYFSDLPVEIDSVRFTSADICAVQGPRYTSLEMILNARNLSNAFPS